MGYNTTIVVHNDSLHDIERDPDFGKKLVAAIRKLDLEQGDMIDVSAGASVNAVEVIEQHHADQIKLIAVGANGGWEVPGYAHWQTAWKLEEMKLALLKSFAQELGYRVSKIPAKKTDLLPK